MSTIRKLLTKTKFKRFSRKIYGFDIETYDNNRKFYCASVCSYDGSYKKTFFSKEAIIKEFQKKMYAGSYIAVTNLKFDFAGVFHGHPLMCKFQFVMNGGSMLFAKANAGKDFSTKKKTLTFIDTGNYAKLSVEDLGKLIDIPKLELPDGLIGRLPKNKKEKDIMIEYNMRDSEISAKALKFLYDSFIDLGVQPKLTIASTSMRLFTNKYLDKKYIQHKIEDLKWLKEGYYGGRTEVFKRGFVKDYEYYDVNSLYPFVMHDFEYPDPNSLCKSNRDTIELIMKFHGVSDVTIEAPDMKYPILPLRGERLLFPVGEFRSKQSHVELRYALENGYKIKKVHRTYYYTRTCIPFKGFVSDLYKKRLSYGKSAMGLVVKLIMNSLYGKFIEWFVDKDVYTPFTGADQLEGLDKFDIIDDTYLRYKEDREPKSHCIPIWGLYITSYARIHLHKFIVATNPVYCDTDSVVTKTKIETGAELGMMKHEGHVDRGYFIKPKFYYMDLDDKPVSKIKGVSVKLEYCSFTELLSNPKVKYKHFMGLKEAMNRNMMPNEIVDMVKVLDLEDTKRDWKGKFNKNILQDSSPLIIIDGISNLERDRLQKKVDDLEEKNRKKKLKKFFKSDLFDSHSVGNDISDEEFLENEKFFAMQE